MFNFFIDSLGIPRRSYLRTEIFFFNYDMVFSKRTEANDVRKG